MEHPVAVVVASCFIAMFVASCFMSLFDVAFDSLIFSWLHDGKQSSVVFAARWELWQRALRRLRVCCRRWDSQGQMWS